MSDWMLIDRPRGEGPYGIAGYSVLDALGLRLGYISGWVTDRDAHVRMVKVTVREWFDTKGYLVPIGSITLLDDERGQIQLCELTKRSLPKYCMGYEEELPEPRLLKGLIRFFPNPRPSVVERLRSPEEVPALAASRLTARQDQGDGSRVWEQSAFVTGPNWIRLERLGPPDWTRLSDISFDVVWRV